MKKKFLLFALLAMVLSLVLTACGDRQVIGLEIIDGTFKYEYEVGEKVDLSGLKVKASYNDGSFKEVGVDELTIESFNTDSVGTKTLKISYLGYSINIDVKVIKTVAVQPQPAKLTGITLDATSVASSVKVLGTLDVSKLAGTATYDDGTTKALTAADLTIVTAVDTSTSGTKTLKASYEGKEATLTVTVVGVKTLTVIGVPEKIIAGATLDTTGASALVEYTDGTGGMLTASQLTFAAFDSSVAGNDKALTVTYLDGTATVPVDVLEFAAIGVETESINSLITNIPEGTAVDLAAIKAQVTVNLLYGYVGGDIALDESVALTDKTNLSVTEVTEGGKRYVKLSYEGREKLIEVLVGEPIVTGITVVGGFDATVKVGDTFSPAGLKISATLSNGGTKTVTYAEGGDIAVDASQIGTAAGKYTISVSYAGESATADVYVLGITAIGLAEGQNLGTVKRGETLSVAGLKFVVTYSYEGQTPEYVTVDISNTTVGTINTDVAAGDHTFTVTYGDVSCNVTYHVIEVKSIAITQGSKNYTVVVVGTPKLDMSKLEFILTYTDGSTETVSGTDPRLSLYGENYSAAGNVNVSIKYNDSLNYGTDPYGSFPVEVSNVIIIDVNQPTNFTESGINARKNSFINKSHVYVVGDDNAFIYTLDVSAYDANGNKVNVTSYVSKSLVYLVDASGNKTLLEGSELDKYVAIDESKNAFDFTDAAIGKTFMISTRPAHGVYPEDEAKFTKTFQFEVVDAWNIYTAKDLNVITNFDDTDDFVMSDGTTKIGQLKAIRNFLGTGYAYPDYNNFKGVVIHNNLTVTIADLPPEYFVASGTDSETGNPTYRLLDYVSVYAHTNKGEFSFYGNHYQINSYNIPAVIDEADDGVSHSHFFLFTMDEYDNKDLVLGKDAELPEGKSVREYFNHENFKLYIQDVYLMDDDQYVATDSSSIRSKLGLIGMKIRRQTVQVENTRIERYYLQFFPDRDYITVNLNEVKLYNAWQNHIYAWAYNDLQSGLSTEAQESNPYFAHYQTIVINVTNSEITKCGGPIIISQVNQPGYGCQSESGAQITIDTDTTIQTYVKSDSVWFQAFGATPYAAGMTAIGTKLGADFTQDGTTGMPTGGLETTFVCDNPTGYTGSGFMNMLMVHMAAGHGVDPSSAANTLNGSLTFVDEATNTRTTVMNMKEQSVATVRAATTYAAPVFQTPYVEGTPYTTTMSQTAFWYAADSTQPGNGMLMDVNNAPIVNTNHGALNTDNGKVTIYYLGLGIVFGDYHKTK